MATETVQPGCQLPEDLVSILDGLGNAETVARQLVESFRSGGFGGANERSATSACDMSTKTIMTVHTNKILVQRYYEQMWNTWNFALADELLSEEICFRGSLGAEMRGRAAFCQYMRRVQNAFPDFHNKIEQLVAEGDQVVARLKYTGTHRGEIFGVRPSGKSISYASAAFFRIAGNRVAEGWVLGDLVSLLRQLGAQTLPSPTN